MGDEGGYGIRFNHASVGDIIYSISRAVEVYKDDKLSAMRRYMMAIDNSWDNSALQYIEVYSSLVNYFKTNDQ
jgi:starch synthase